MVAARYLPCLVSAVFFWALAVGGEAGGQQPKAKKAGPKAKTAELETADAYGRPEGSIVDQTARYYVWYDGQMWHLRTTAKQARNFNGTLRVKEATFKSCVPVGLKNDRQKKSSSDGWRMNDERSELKFAFRTAALSDGLDIVVDGDGEIEFELLIDTQKNPRAVFLGRKGEHPSQNPFRMSVKPQREAK